MKIIVNTRLLIENKLEGIGWFTYETLLRITKAHPEIDFKFVFDRESSDSFLFSDNITAVTIGPPTRHPILWNWWFQKSIPKLLAKEKPDLFLSTDGFLPLDSPTPTYTVIHDLNFEHRPKDIPRSASKYYRKYFPKFAHTATRIGTVSEYSKQDIVKLYGINNDKIDVVYNGASSIFKPLNKEDKKEIRLKYSADCEYFIYVGAFHPRKNLTNLSLAFEAFKKSTGSKTKLVLVGEKMMITDELEKTINSLSYKSDIIQTGRLNHDELAKVVASAKALTYVPFFEGFGIPIIEAMNCGVPVVTSNVTSMPEVSSDAALLVNPNSIDEIANALKKIDSDEKLASELIEKGNQRKQDFSWDRTADLLWSGIEKVLENA